MIQRLEHYWVQNLAARLISYHKAHLPIYSGGWSLRLPYLSKDVSYDGYVLWRRGYYQAPEPTLSFSRSAELEFGAAHFWLTRRTS